MHVSRVVLLLAAAAVILAAACEKPEEKPNVIAVVGDEYLTVNHMLDEIPDQLYSNLTATELREFVLMWINNQVLYQEALERRLDKSPELKRELEKLRQELLISKLIDRTLSNGVTATEEEISNYYETNKEGFILTDDLVRANHIVVATQKEANAVRKRLRGGESFEQVAREINADSTLNGEWDLGYFARDEIIPEISKVAFSMPVGSYSYPIKSDFGYHVIQVVEKQKKGDVRKLETVREEIKLKIEAKKRQDRKQRFLLQLKSKFKIYTNFQLLDSAIVDSLLQKETFKGVN